MANISIQRGSSFTHTVSGTGRNARQMSTARLNISLASRSVRNFSPTSFGEGTATFTGTLSDDDFRRFAACGLCEWRSGQYAVFLGADLSVSATLETGSVSVSGTLPCVDCGGDDPPGDGGGGGGGGGDGSYGPITPWTPLVPPPTVPDDYCLPSDFAVTPPAIPTPCSSGSGEGASSGFE